MCQFDRATIIIHCAQRITPGAKGDHFGSPVNQSLEVVPIELTALGIHLRDVQGDSTFFNQSLPGRHVGMMFEFGDDDLITWSKGSAKSTRQMIDD
jgi:hypothetical protein